jgi:tetratricopeptide (TPR) repeat protein
MTPTDSHDCPVSGTTPAALEAFEHALARFVSWRADALPTLETALREAPGFAMAHVLRAYMDVCSRDPQRVRRVRAQLGHIARAAGNERERMHVQAIAAALADDYLRMRGLLGELLRRYPRDLLALHVAHSLDYVSGDTEQLASRVARARPAWSPALPGFHAVLAMHAFGLEEAGDYARAEDLARQALALNPWDARAHHAVAHVLEMTGRAADGVRWMHDRAHYWAAGTVAATHCWWHLALFHLAQGDVETALRLYDQRVRAERSHEVADLIDASALLWRIGLVGDAGQARWHELAAAWSPRIDERFCTFNDLHAMLAFVGAGDDARASRLEHQLLISSGRATRHGETTRLVGLPACRALRAFGGEDHATAARLLSALPPLAHRIGGSHAQRDVLNLTRAKAMQRAPRRPARQAQAVAASADDAAAVRAAA